MVEVAPPTDKIKKILGKLADLPAEAKKEAQTVEELRTENAQLKRDLRALPQKVVENDPKVVEKAVLSRDKEWGKVVENWKSFAMKMVAAIDLFNMVNTTKFPAENPDGTIKVYKNTYQHIPKDLPSVMKTKVYEDHPEITGVEKKFGACSKAIYSYLSQNDARFSEYTKTQVAVATGYSQNSGGFNNSISELSAAGLIERGPAGLRAVIHNYRQELIVPIDKSLEKWGSKLGMCSRKIWEFMLEHQDNDGRLHSKDTIATATGYSVTSGGFNNSISELSALGLIERLSGGMVRINPEILSL